ncbi:hypothetical protein AB0F77_22605 [Streptomyces sp. NPDC026672]|uniref:hypothetical protein n=1 Tax=unclassified Streptomyces TaxID=2593676 RepID=UPI0033C12403
MAYWNSGGSPSSCRMASACPPAEGVLRHATSGGNPPLDRARSPLAALRRWFSEASGQ